MKKVYMTPCVETQKINVSNIILTGSISGSVDGGDGPGYGGIDDGSNELDVKGESWTDIWE